MTKKSHNLHADARARVNQKPNTNKTAHVPARVNHSPVPVTNTDRRPRVIQNPIKHKIQHVPARGEPKCERKPTETTIPSPLSHFPNGTVIHKLFNKEYRKARVTRYNAKRAYYTV